MSERRSRIRRGAAGLAVVAVVAGTALVAGAGPAGATDDAGHICQGGGGTGVGGFWLDNGPLSDPIHHHVEPALPILHDAVSCPLARLLEDDGRPGGADDLLDRLLPSLFG